MTKRLPPARPLVDARGVRSRVALALAFALSATVAVAPAAAKEPSAAEIALAKDLLKDAVVEAKKGNCKDALDLATQAIAIKETADALMLVGQCQADLGNLLEGLATLQKAEDLARETKDKATQQALVQKVAAVRERIPTIALALPADVTAPSIKLDGAAVTAEKAEKPIEVAPGAHTIEVSADGRTPFSKKLNVNEKERATVTVVLPKVGADTPPGNDGGENGDTPSGGGLKIPLISWVAGSAAVVLAAGGVVAFVVAGDAATDGEEECAKLVTCDEGAIDSVRQLDAAALGLWIGAGVGAAVAVTFVILESGGDAPASASGSATARTRRPRSAGPSAKVSVGAGSLSLSGRF